MRRMSESDRERGRRPIPPLRPRPRAACSPRSSCARRSRASGSPPATSASGPEAIQPASIDLRLGDFAWALRCSFLPDVESPVAEKLAEIAFQKIDLRDGATLERDRPYLIPLVEELALPDSIRAKANPKSSTGRLDVFTRVITDRNHRFDEIRPGYHGKLYLEVVPRSFAIYVRQGLALNQLRLSSGDARLDDPQLARPASAVPAALRRPAPAARDRAGDRRRALPQRRPARRPGRPRGRLPGEEEQPADRPRPDPRLPLERLLGSGASGARARGSCSSRRSSICCSRPRGSASRPGYAAEMMAYDPTAGELRTHYAGFFDPGFGFDAAQRPPRQPRRARGPGPGRAVHGRAPPADLQARRSSAWARPRTSSTAPTSARTTRAR